MRIVNPIAAKLDQQSHSILTLMVMVMIILLIQLWLLNIALEEYMAAHSTMAIPTFAASAFCLMINLVLLRYLRDVNRKRACK